VVQIARVYFQFVDHKELFSLKIKKVKCVIQQILNHIIIYNLKIKYILLLKFVYKTRPNHKKILTINTLYKVYILNIALPT